jgi:hypothetical protein
MDYEKVVSTLKYFAKPSMSTSIAAPSMEEEKSWQTMQKAVSPKPKGNPPGKKKKK